MVIITVCKAAATYKKSISSGFAKEKGSKSYECETDSITVGPDDARQFDIG